MKPIKTWFKEKGKIIKDEFTADAPSKIVQNLLYVLLGTLIFSIADSFFLLPMNIISGGISSMSLISHSIPGMSKIPVNTYVLIYTWGFFLLGLIFIGLKYSLKTLVFTIGYPLFVMLFSWVIRHAVIDGRAILDITQVADIRLENGKILSADGEGLEALSYVISAITGGTLMGVGIGFCYTGGGSSGGTDVINTLVHKYFHVRVGTSSFICDLILIAGGFFANGCNLLASLVGIVAALLCSVMIDRVFLGNSQYYVAMVISPKWSQMNDFLNNQLGRGTTLIQAKGGYTKEDTVILNICFGKEEYGLIRQMIQTMDPNAFVTIVRTNEILGYGFSRDTPTINMKDVALTPDDTRKLIIQAKKKRKKMFNE